MRRIIGFARIGRFTSRPVRTSSSCTCVIGRTDVCIGARVLCGARVRGRLGESLQRHKARSRMARGKHATALFEVIHTAKLKDKTTEKSGAFKTPKWWFKGRD